MKSVVALDAEKSHLEAIRALSPAQRLQAFRRLCEQVEALRRAGAAVRAARSEPRSP